MGRYIAKEMGRDVSEMSYDYLTSESFRKDFGQATFFHWCFPPFGPDHSGLNLF